jgi:formamidopyrimidine-DNA glycosylase
VTSSGPSSIWRSACRADARLPDVEGFRRVFAEHAAGRTVERVEVLDRSMLRNRRPQALGRLLAGQRR